MRKPALVATVLIVLLGSASVAAAQRSTMYDWNVLSPPQADFLAQQRIGRHYANPSMSKITVSTNPSLAGDPEGQVSLTSSQKSAIFRGAIARAQSAPSGFQPSMGATVPQSLTLYAFDDRVQSLVPAAKEYDYVKLPGNDVLLVDPRSRQIVAMVEGKDVTGNK